MVVAPLVFSHPFLHLLALQIVMPLSAQFFGLHLLLDLLLLFLLGLLLLFACAAITLGGGKKGYAQQQQEHAQMFHDYKGISMIMPNWPKRFGSFIL